MASHQLTQAIDRIWQESGPFAVDVQDAKCVPFKIQKRLFNFSEDNIVVFKGLFIYGCGELSKEDCNFK